MNASIIIIPLDKKPLQNPNASNISLSRKKNILAMKQNGDNKSEVNLNEQGYIDDNKFNYPLKSQNQLYEKQNTFSELSGRMVPSEKNYFLTPNQQFIRKKSNYLFYLGSITPESDSKPKDDVYLMKKSLETNSASNLMKKIKSPLDYNNDKKRSELLSNSNSNKLLNAADSSKMFSSTQKKSFGLALKINKSSKEPSNEGPYTNRYDYPSENQDRFFNNNETKINGPKNLLNYENQNDALDRSKSTFASTNLGNQSNSLRNMNYDNSEKFVRNEQNINSNMITNNNISKVESYTKKFGQILNKNDKKL